MGIESSFGKKLAMSVAHVQEQGRASVRRARANARSSANGPPRPFGRDLTVSLV